MQRHHPCTPPPPRRASPVSPGCSASPYSCSPGKPTTRTSKSPRPTWPCSSQAKTPAQPHSPASHDQPSHHHTPAHPAPPSRHLGSSCRVSLGARQMGRTLRADLGDQRGHGLRHPNPSVGRMGTMKQGCFWTLLAWPLQALLNWQWRTFRRIPTTPNARPDPHE